MNSSLTDLDELVLKCKDLEARKHISEAIACYKAGAFRACIVTTWIAVVYDFLSKLRVLREIEDSKAIEILTSFENARKTNDIRRSLEIEKDILTMAHEDFEFLSPVERNELMRLMEDRNRCAHPSMISEDAVYEPSAELARYHLRNAVNYLLQHPAVQGAQAIRYLENEVNSPYFPGDIERAIRKLKDGPIAYPRESLIRNFIKILVKGLLEEDKDVKRYQILSVALNAVRQMHRNRSEQILADELPKLVLGKSTPAIIRLLSEIRDTWQYLTDSSRVTIETYVENASEREIVGIFDSVLNINELLLVAKKRLTTSSTSTVETLINIGPRSEYIEHAIALYSESASVHLANLRTDRLVVPLIEFMNADHYDRIVECGIKNKFICDSPAFLQVLRSIRHKAKMDFDNLLSRHDIPSHVVSAVYNDDDFTVEANKRPIADDEDPNWIPF